MKLSVVIPAYNEENGIGLTLDSIPVKELESVGYEVEKIVVNNGSSDNTAQVARQHGAKVVYQPKRGYGYAYHAGFMKATGTIIATGDADMTYPFDHLPEILRKMEAGKIDFMNTDRLTNLNKGIMQPSHIIGNYILSRLMRGLFNTPFHDSQSGMWVFKRSIWTYLSVENAGMPFSQEIKIEAYMKGFRCGETPIEYRRRVGQGKLSIMDAWRTMYEMFKKRIFFDKHALNFSAEEVD